MAKARILGLDYGVRRIGVAISDPLGITSQPLATLRNRKDKVMEEIAAIIQEKQVATVVVGLPKHMSGQEGTAAETVRSFGNRLQERCTVPVEFVDERLSTVAAQRVLTQSGMSGPKQRQVVDKLAAAIILQTWMDSKRLI
ncbi:Holliday junction resolvase RuvX [bacterium]|nr:Holliday junction resolvase RuvX [bacterium]